MPVRGVAKGEPLVSVLLPVFNAASTLTAALQSIRRQTVQSWECVIADDGSSDRSREILSAVSAQDQRFRVLTLPHDGLVAALNAGLPQCRGVYIARMDADDVMHPARLGAQVRALESDPSVDVVGCHVRVFPRGHLRQGRIEYESWLNEMGSTATILGDAYVECPLAHPTWLARRDAMLSFGYREEGWPEDYDLMLRWIHAGLRPAVVPRRLHFWRDAPTRLSRLGVAYSRSSIVACKAAHLANGVLRRSDGYVLWGYGDTGRALARALLTRGKRPRYIVELHPGRLGQRILGAPVVPPGFLRQRVSVPVVVSVAGPVARRQIREALYAMAYEEGTDFVVAA